jgi:hypothetical protein
MLLEIPVTIRVPTPDEMDHREDIHELLQKRKRANIVEGFDLQPNETQQLPFKFYAAINVNHSRLWEVFEALANTFPEGEEVSCVYGLEEEEPVTTGYFPRQQVLAELRKFKTELTGDASLSFGLLLHTKEMLMELFVTESKYIKFWGSNKESFVQQMLAFDIRPVPQLEFVDEYPKITEPLRKFVPAAKHPKTVIHGLGEALG